MVEARQGEGRSYVQYGLLALSLVSFIRKSVLPKKEPLNALSAFQAKTEPEHLTLSQKLARRIVSGALKQKDMDLEDIQKSQEKRAYEETLKVLPIGNESFVIHTEPEIPSINITSTRYVDGKVPEHFVEEVPTLETVAFENSKKPARLLVPAWESGMPLSVEYYLNSNVSYDRKDYDPQDIYTWKGTLDDVNFDTPETLNSHFNLSVPKNLDGGLIYMHLYMMTKAASNQIEDSQVIGKNTIQLSYRLKKLGKAKKSNLLSPESSDGEQFLYEENVPFWHPNITVYLGQPFGIVETDQVPSSMADLIATDESGLRDSLTGLGQRYFPPVLYFSFWQTTNSMIEITPDTEQLPVNLKIEIPVAWKFRVAATIMHGLKKQLFFGDSSEASASIFALDYYKNIWLGTNKWVLILTAVATALHSVLGVLALKNDATHWRVKQDQVGISLRGLGANILMQTITFLYLLDNSEGTSSTIYVSQALGILLECWKVSTILKFGQTTDQRPSENEVVRIPFYGGKYIVLCNKRPLTEEERKTQEYDAKAFQVLIWVFVPLILSYAGYSLAYGDYKSWYSFFVTVMVGVVYTYGFLIQLPSVYINYKLKSVAHMPKRAFAYKAVNTFIDDLFAYVTKMPWLHRLATLRDDVVFFIFLYQFWAYRVDYTRVNEFGESSATVNEKIE